MSITRAFDSKKSFGAFKLMSVLNGHFLVAIVQQCPEEEARFCDSGVCVGNRLS